MKQTVLLLYGSLTVGLAVTLFGSFEPLHLSSEWFAVGISWSCNGEIVIPEKIYYNNKHYQLEKTTVVCDTNTIKQHIRMIDGVEG